MNQLRDYSDFEAHQTNSLAWAVDQWKSQVKDRPLTNPLRETLDHVWREVVSFHGGDPNKLLGPDHFALVDYYRKKEEKKKKAEAKRARTAAAAQEPKKE